MARTPVFQLPSEKTTSPPSYLSADEVNAIGGLEGVLLAILGLYQVTALQPTDFNGTAVAGCLHVTISGGTGFPRFSDGSIGVRRVVGDTLLTGLAPSSTNYVYLHQEKQGDIYFSSNTTGVPPDGSVLVFTCYTNTSQVISVDNAPAGRRHLGDMAIGPRSVFSQLTEVNVAGGSGVTLKAGQFDTGVIRLYGTLTANIVVTVPAETGRVVWVWNDTGGAYTVTWTPSGRTGVVVPRGVSCIFQTSTAAILLSAAINRPTNTAPEIYVSGNTIQSINTSSNLIIQGGGGAGIGFNYSSGTGGVVWYNGGTSLIASLAPWGTFYAIDFRSATTGGYHLGHQSDDTTWRWYRSGDNVVFQRRESGIWVTKATLSNAGQLTLTTISASNVAGSLAQLFASFSLSVGPESDDVIRVSLQAKDAANSNLSKSIYTHVWLANGVGEGPTSTAPSGGWSITTGYVVETVTASISARCVTNTSGLLEIDITETGTGTWYLHAECGGIVYVSSAITFS